jgi:hypothetical protein
MSSGERCADEFPQAEQGQVYRAIDRRLGRKVAVKIAAQQFGERLEREARAI